MRVDGALIQGGFANITSLDGTVSTIAPMLDPQFGGMFGYAPNLKEWVSGAAYVRKDLICIVMEFPRGLYYMPEPNSWIAAFKALYETHPTSIEGFNSKLTVSVVDTPVSGGGSIQQDPSDVKRENSAPTFNWTEKYGRPIQTLLTAFIHGLVMDPDSKVADIATIDPNQVNGDGTIGRPNDLLPDMNTFTMLFFEPDPTHTKVNNAWLCANMMPMDTGDIIGKRELANAKDKLDLSIQHTALVQTNNGVRAFAQNVLNNINFLNANPYQAPAFLDGIYGTTIGRDPGLEGTNDNGDDFNGYAEQANNLSNAAVNKMI